MESMVADNDIALVLLRAEEEIVESLLLMQQDVGVYYHA